MWFVDKWDLIGKSVISLHTVSGSNRSIISDVWEFFKGYPVVNKILPMKLFEKSETRTRNTNFLEARKKVISWKFYDIKGAFPGT